MALFAPRLGFIFFVGHLCQGRPIAEVNDVGASIVRPKPGTDTSASVWLTKFHADALPELLLEAQESIAFSSSRIPARGRRASVSVNVDVKLQEMVGYGAAMPHSSAKVLTDLKRRDLALYHEVLERMFGSGAKSAAFNMMRFPIGVCDFSMAWATWDDQESDFGMLQFKPDADTELILEVLTDATSINDELLLMATPWTPPAWMKTNKSLAGVDNNNTLVDSERVYKAYAKYLVQAVAVIKARGLKLAYLSLQNEPLNGHTDIPAMHFDALQEARLAKEVRPLLDTSVKLLAYDHNWDRADYPVDALLKSGGNVFAGTAWHCYGGDMAFAQDANHELFSKLEQHLTECMAHYDAKVGCNISQGWANFGWDHDWDMKRLFLGNAAHWGQSGLKWVSALDENCGPALTNFTNWTPRALLAVPSWAKHIDDVVFNQDFWTIAHMARFVRQGARRVMTTGDRGDALLLEAFEDARSRTITLMAHNSDHDNAIELDVQYSGAYLSYSVPAWGTAVIVWPTGVSVKPPSVVLV